MERPDRAAIGALLPHGLMPGRELVCVEQTDSTNSLLRAMAEEGAPHATVVVACGQRAGRGRQGRSFESPPGEGLYLSLLLRLSCTAEQAMELTPRTAVAVADAVEACCGVRPRVKWVNDLLLNGRKVCGILTELGLDGQGCPSYAVIGVGINITQSRGWFEAHALGEVATSLAAEGVENLPGVNELAAAVITALDTMAAGFPHNGERWLERYRADCVTAGRDVLVRKGQGSEPAFALRVEEDFSLSVRYTDGREERLQSGEVSVRGQWED